MKHQTFKNLEALARGVGVSISPFNGNAYQITHNLYPKKITPVVETTIYWIAGRLRFETRVYGIVTDLPTLIEYLQTLEAAKQVILASEEAWDNANS